MTVFHYVARDADDRRFAGSVKADSADKALELISQQYPLVTRLEHQKPNQSGNPFRRKIKGEDILGFCETLSALLDGGINLKRAMDTLLGDTENSALRNVVMDLTEKIGAGDSLSKALSRHPQVFDTFFVNMIAAGESSGELPEMVRRVASYLQKMQDMKDKVRAALVYPAVVLSFAGLLVGAILTFGVPYLQELYDGLGIQLPLATRILSGLGGFLNQNIFLVFLMGGLSFYLFQRFAVSNRGKLLLDGLKLRAPIARGVFVNLYTARFARTLGLLYSSGIPLFEALELTGNSIGNQLVTATFSATRDALRRGDSLSDSLRSNDYFTDAAIGLISAGEESGRLDTMFFKVADFYDRRVDNKLESLTSVVEPLIMIGVGLVIGGIIIALGLPFLTLASNF